ncbi:hypothetical protein CSA37_11795 [Candidatus Fermentibacteria bacterium]|nr:MAG: hypothetical protein CSA37_11795 [Candidatus Fermentibacteria bacterium]
MNEVLGESLFGKVRRKVLAVFVLNPDRSFYLLELIRLVDCGRGGVQREVSRLASAGIITRQRAGNQVHYRANINNLIYGELRAIFSKTTGLLDLLRSSLNSCSEPLGMAFVYGDYAEGKAFDNSPINLLVIGDTPLKAVKECTSSFSEETSRKLNITVLSTGEFKRLILTGDRKVREILGAKRIFFAGGEKELSVLSTTGDDLFSGLF